MQVTRSARRAAWGIGVVWVFTLIGSGAIVFGRYLGWWRQHDTDASFAALSLVLAGATIVSLFSQMLLHEPRGYIGRVSASICGAVVIAATAALVLLLVLGR